MLTEYRLPVALARAAKAKILVLAGLWAALTVLSIPVSAQSALPAAPGSASLMNTPGQKNWAYLSGDTLSGHADKEVVLEGNAQMLRSDA